MVLKVQTPTDQKKKNTANMTKRYVQMQMPINPSDKEMYWLVLFFFENVNNCT